MRFSLSLLLGRVCFQSCRNFLGVFCLLAALVWDYGPNSGSQFCQWDLDFGVVKSINETTI